MTANLIQSLMSPRAFPHDTSGIVLLETHISWVLLTGEFAYKIKKPVNLGFLDFSTLTKRKFYCDEELRLNSRFSAGLYLAVVAITGSAEKPAIDGKGTVVDYAVKMRQFDQHNLLEQIAATDALTLDDIKSLARKLADFHQHQAARLAQSDTGLGTVQSVCRAAMENFQQIAPALKSETARQSLNALRQWSETRMAALQTVFAERRASGFVRECHGDLHLRNIARIDSEITFFDCIEFSAQLRWIDVQSELAFLLMDMEDKKLSGFSNRLLNLYLEHTGDYGGLAVLQFYKVYRAMVRAKVMVLKLNGSDEPEVDEADIWQQYGTYITLAQSYCEPPRPFLGLMHGISGSGKSTVAATLASEYGAIRIRSDVERKRLFGLTPDTRSTDQDKQQMYSETASNRTFEALYALGEKLLGLGYPVLVDATFIEEKRRRPFLELASALRLPMVIIDCSASEATLVERLEQRRKKTTGVSEAGVGEMRKQRANMQPFTPNEFVHVLKIDTDQQIDGAALAEYLKKEAPP